jgi:predicted AlkP superfamily pyrophosphatase or phosphodiesterase
MRAASPLLSRLVLLALVLGLMPNATGTAYDGHPRLIVVIVIDQFRGDYLERYRNEFGVSGFRTFLDRGAYFENVHYDYANTQTAPGHATLLSGAYSDGHGIIANEWWNPDKKKMVTSVEDGTAQLVGIPGKQIGASPRNLTASNLGDELKLATQGKARVFGISLKDRAAILPAGHAADAAYWIDHDSGAWITSTYYRTDLPKWVSDFNGAKRTQKYWDREWRDAEGNTLRSTAHTKRKDGTEAGFYEVVGSTPFANEYEFEFAKELVLYEQLGTGPATDLLTISLSANDILGHQVGPDSPEIHAMALALDLELNDFFEFLGHQVGLANCWLALSADHGVAPLPSVSSKFRLSSGALDKGDLRVELNKTLSSKLSPGKPTEFVRSVDFPLTWLNDEAFAAAHIKEDDAERDVGEALKKAGVRGYFTKSQLASGSLPDTDLSRQYLHSYVPIPAWYVYSVMPPFTVGSTRGTDHVSPYSYDTWVPLAIYGLPFQPGTYRAHAEPVDLAVTLSSLLGIVAPSNARGRVLTEALAPSHHEGSSDKRTKPGEPQPRLAPAAPQPNPGASRP